MHTPIKLFGFPLLLCVLASGWCGPLAGEVPNQKQVRPEQFRNPAIIEFKGEINWQLSKYFRSRLQQAKAAGVDLLVIQIDSPGGLKNESLDIAEQLRDIDWAYTVAFVPRQAISGGALITLGCDELMVGANARIGDIGVIEFDPELFAFRFAPAKIQSVLVRQARDLASSKGRSPELAESMIDKDVMTFRQETPEGVVFKNARIDAAELPTDPWALVEESGPERFLTISGQRAKTLGLAAGLASNRKELAAAFDLQTADFRIYRRTITDRVVYFLNHPLGTVLLIIVGMVALFLELSAPGLGVGGLISGLCAVLFFWSRVLGGTSSWLEIILFTAGAVFLLMELFVIPGWGLPGLVGLALMVGSIFLAGQDFVMPRTDRQWNQFLTSAVTLTCTAVVFAVLAVFITKRLGSLPVFNRLLLAPVPSPEGELSSAAIAVQPVSPDGTPHPEVSIGDRGHAESLLRPAGRAVFSGSSFDVVSDGAFIEQGQQIKVIDVQGNRIVVALIGEVGMNSTVRGSDS